MLGLYGWMEGIYTDMREEGMGVGYLNKLRLQNKKKKKKKECPPNLATSANPPARTRKTPSTERRL